MDQGHFNRAEIARGLSSTALAALLGVSLSTVNRWRAQNRGPKPVKIGGRVRYLESDLARWLADAQGEG